MRRYWLTDKAFKRTEPSRVLTQGWSTTRLLLVAAARVASASPDRGFTLADLTVAVNATLQQHGILFVGVTTYRHHYSTQGERIVRGRFGDMRRAGYFTPEAPLQAGCREARYNSRNNIYDLMEELLGCRNEPGPPEPAATGNPT
ncbi:MAG TPA: hypothetical protein VGO93_04075 [Candidatus Xenobia bacterium]|jgi:hypothetical protein